jgi:hypothetical protein
VQFVASFEMLNDMRADEVIDPIAWQLSVGEPDQYGCKTWRPAKIATDASLLEPLYMKLPARFPPLFEKLVLSYRWAEVDLGAYRLRANPPGPDLAGLLGEISKDDFLFQTLIRNGFIPFGKGPDVDYDPVCFDLTSRKKNADYGIVKIDHEEILCNERIQVVGKLAPSFEELVVQTIERGTTAKLNAH